jgi:hypothetical protein
VAHDAVSHFANTTDAGATQQRSSYRGKIPPLVAVQRPVI